MLALLLGAKHLGTKNQLQRAPGFVPKACPPPGGWSSQSPRAIHKREVSGLVVATTPEVAPVRCLSEQRDEAIHGRSVGPATVSGATDVSKGENGIGAKRLE